MNFRKLITYLTMGTAAAMPLAVAQNPTILQGNYITNVFGNSNFVLNPNAQTNVANVTNATRSTTTPLVATSEFTLSLASGANATWTLRAFDAGMKGQNCEARFTYRGFATATTTAEIVQNSLVVASLTLTPTTDPRIASINFPCGDLANATTFRIAQTTAAMTGTNEIGGIYVGLATNMANVAQAEEVGSIYYAGTTNCEWDRTGAGSNTDGNFAADADCPTGTVTGAADTSAGKIPGAKFNNLKPGKYMFVVSTTGFRVGSANDSVRFRLSDGTNFSSAGFIYQPTSGDTYAPLTLILTQEYTTTTSPTIQVQGATSTTTNTVRLYNSAGVTNFKLTAYRFPSSSELVVTPERAAIKYASNTGGEGTAANTNYTNSTYFSSAENGSIFPNLTQSVANTQTCYDASFGEPIKVTDKIEIQYGTNSGEWYSIDSSTAAIQAFSYNNGKWYGMYVETKTASTGLIKTCFGNSGGALIGAYGSTTVTDYYTWASAWGANRRYRIVKIPASASNSALYVQGPVKASETGAAIPAGYVGEKVTWTSAPSTQSFTTTVADWTNASISLNPGVWLIYASVNAQIETAATSGSDTECAMTITNSAGTVQDNQEKLMRMKTAGNVSVYNNQIISTSFLANVTSAGTIFKIRGKRADVAGGAGVCHFFNTTTAYSHFYAIRLN